MRLVRVQASYFRQYKKTEIFFPEIGMIGILGPNGAGKSTLFNGIQWALYGKIKDITNDMIKNQSAGKKDPCFFEIDFIYQDQYYRVHRDLVSSRCFVQIDGRTRAMGTTSVNQFVEEEIFKMDHKTFCTCYYAEQEDFDALVKLNPGPRVKMLTKLVRIEAIDAAIELTRKEKRLLEAKIVDARKRMRDEEVISKQKEDCIAAIASLRKQFETCEKTILQHDESYKNLLVKKADGDIVYRKYIALASYIQKEETERNNLEKMIVEPAEQKRTILLAEKANLETILTEIAPLSAFKVEQENMTALQMLFQEKTQIIQDVKRTSEELKRYEEDIVNIEHQLKQDENIAADLLKKEKQAEEALAKVTALRETYQELAHDAKTIKAAIAEKEKTKKRFDDLGEDAPCTTCERPLGEHYGARTQHLSEEIEELKKELVSINEQGGSIRTQGEERKKIYDEILREVDNLRSKFVEREKREERFASLHKERENRNHYVRELEERYQKVKDVHFDAAKYLHLTNEMKRLSPLNEEAIKLAERIQEIPTLEIQIRNAKNNMLLHDDALKGFVRDQKNLNFDEKAYDLLSAQVDEAQQRKSEALEEKSSISTAIAVEEGNVKVILEKIAENESIANEMKIDEREIALLTKLDKVYAAYKIDKLAKLSPALSDIMSDLMDRITDGKYDRVELDDSYNIQMYRGAVKNPLEFYSGGEKKLAALCQRLAISNLLVSQTGQSNFEMLAMDEVFGSMDNARQDGLLEMLRNLNEMFPQILIVTHSDYVKDSFDHVLEVKMNANGYSEAGWESYWDDKLVRDRVEAYNQSLEESEENDGDEDEAV